GPAGPRGATGPAGPAGTIVCRNTPAAKVLCTLEFAPGSFTTALRTQARFRVEQGQHTVVSAQLPAKSTHGVIHASVGRLTRGRYTLIITTGHGRSAKTVLRLAFRVR
ncbi:MAG: hypothetical protein WBQ18_19230, partial [Solirubrobacteraceae bacterium]